MANDTKVAIPGRVTVEKLIEGLNWLSRFPISENEVIKNDVELKDFNTRPKTKTLGGVPCPIIYCKNENLLEYGFITILYRGEYRQLFYHYDSRFILDPENIERNIDNGYPEFNRDFTTLSLGMDQNAIDLLTEVARYFDGYIDEDDCDNQYYHKVQ